AGKPGSGRAETGAGTHGAPAAPAKALFGLWTSFTEPGAPAAAAFRILGKYPPPGGEYRPRRWRRTQGGADGGLLTSSCGRGRPGGGWTPGGRGPLPPRFPIPYPGGNRPEG